MFATTLVGVSNIVLYGGTYEPPLSTTKVLPGIRISLPVYMFPPSISKYAPGSTVNVAPYRKRIVPCTLKDVPVRITTFLIYVFSTLGLMDPSKYKMVLSLGFASNVCYLTTSFFPFRMCIKYPVP